jgi:hypothetical protein
MGGTTMSRKIKLFAPDVAAVGFAVIRTLEDFIVSFVFKEAHLKSAEYLKLSPEKIEGIREGMESDESSMDTALTSLYNFIGHTNTGLLTISNLEEMAASLQQILKKYAYHLSLMSSEGELTFCQGLEVTIIRFTKVIEDRKLEGKKPEAESGESAESAESARSGHAAAM